MLNMIRTLIISGALIAVTSIGYGAMADATDSQDARPVTALTGVEMSIDDDVYLEEAPQDDEHQQDIVVGEESSLTARLSDEELSKIGLDALLQKAGWSHPGITIPVCSNCIGDLHTSCRRTRVIKYGHCKKAGRLYNCGHRKTGANCF